jgi:hypothetical protein
VRRVFILGVIAGLTGCALNQQSDFGTTSREVRKNGSQPAKRVHVTYQGPEQLTRRFSRFFAIAAGDYGIEIVEQSRDADYEMRVTIAEQEIQPELKAKVLHTAVTLPDGKNTNVDYCETVLRPGDKDTSDDVPELDASRIYAQDVITKFRSAYPKATRFFFLPIKGNVEPLFTEVVKRELVRKRYVIAANAQQADAVITGMETTLEPFGAKAVERSWQIEAASSSGWMKFTHKSKNIIYKSFEQPFPERAKVCIERTKFLTTPLVIMDNDFNAASSSAKALAEK